MLKMISPGGRSNGIVYVPARQGFVSSSSAAATASGGPPVDLFFDLEELRVRSWVHAGRQTRSASCGAFCRPISAALAVWCVSCTFVCLHEGEPLGGRVCAALRFRSLGSVAIASVSCVMLTLGSVSWN